mmetsp:Transcript_6287/g.8297  ORF Transcript_6287/g.8297 Transcript_6287/m.8297 type:complete len:145 (+) Transcript_6287:601-1035(+)
MLKLAYVIELPARGGLSTNGKRSSRLMIELGLFNITAARSFQRSDASGPGVVDGPKRNSSTMASISLAVRFEPILEEVELVDGEVARNDSLSFGSVEVCLVDRTPHLLLLRLRRFIIIKFNQKQGEKGLSKIKFRQEEASYDRS